MQQEADPQWESVRIENPHLKSHMDKTELQAPMYDQRRDYITSYDPATGFHIMTAIADNAPEIEGKIKKAVEAQREWKNTTFTQRRRVIRTLKKWLVDHQKECAQVACRDTGKTSACFSYIFPVYD